jgi:hypothetical protein
VIACFIISKTWIEKVLRSVSRCGLVEDPALLTSDERGSQSREGKVVMGALGQCMSLPFVFAYLPFIRQREQVNQLIGSALWIDISFKIDRNDSVLSSS